MGRYGGLMGRGEQGLTTAATGPLDLRGPSEAVILEAVLLEPSTAGCTFAGAAVWRRTCHHPPKAQLLQRRGGILR